MMKDFYSALISRGFGAAWDRLKQSQNGTSTGFFASTAMGFFAFLLTAPITIVLGIIGHIRNLLRTKKPIKQPIAPLNSYVDPNFHDKARPEQPSNSHKTTPEAAAPEAASAPLELALVAHDHPAKDHEVLFASRGFCSRRTSLPERCCCSRIAVHRKNTMSLKPRLSSRASISLTSFACMLPARWRR